MATSGTYAFNLRIDELIEEAYARAGVGAIQGNDLRSARRSLNMLLTDLSNRAVLLSATSKGEFLTQASVSEYQLSPEVIDIRDVMIRIFRADMPLTSYSQADYSQIPRKDQTGRPVAYFTDRGRDFATVTLWPVPDREYQVSYYGVRRFQDVNEYTETIDLPVKFVTAITSGLAWRLAEKKFASTPAELTASMRETERMRRAELKQTYEEELRRAIDEDTERSSTFILPDLRRRR